MERITLPENKDDLLPSLISDMATTEKGRKALVGALRKNGVSVSDTDDNQTIYTAIYTSLATSRNFRNDLKRVVYSYIKQDEEFANIGGDAGGFLYRTASQVVDPQTGQVRKDVQETLAKKQGTFWAGIFNKENAQALANQLINVATTKLTAKADEKAVKQGIEYQVARTEALEKERLAQQQRAKWIVPVVVVSGIVVVGVIGYFVYRNMKRKKA